MQSTGDNDARSERIEREATAWFVRVGNHEASEAERSVFRDWLTADAEHARAYAEVEALWRDLGQPAKAAAHAARTASPRPRRGFGRAAVALALIAACLALMVWRDPGLFARARADHATPPGQTLEVSLQDGSSLFLDGDSAVTERFADGRREVVLLRGRAWFDVVSDPSKPFLVHSDDIDVRVTGTTFGVDHERGLVTVDHGSVSVAEGGEHLRLSPGQQVASLDGRLAPPRTIDPAAALAWRRGLLVLDAAPLDEVFGEIARMSGRRFLAPQSSVRALRLSGVFTADQPEALIEAMRHGLGLRMVSAPGLVTLVYR